MVEEAAVRQLEREVQSDMEASLGRKGALLEQLQHLCREETLLTSSEALLVEEEGTLAKEEDRMNESYQKGEQQLQTTARNNLQRLQQLEGAQLAFEQQKLLREQERQALREDIAKLDARAAEAEAEIVVTVQRMSDEERRIRLAAVNSREREQSRLEVLQLEVRRLSSQLTAEDS